jgi:DNA-binding transcriptional LysR family regulator
MTSLSRDFTIDLRRLRVLRELEQRGTVAATATAMHLTPSAVSQQLAGLAREVGVPLLEKHGRRVRLTGQARVLLSHAVVVHEQLERARADLAAWDEGTIGEVRVGALSTGLTSLVAPAFARLAVERPGISLKIEQSEPPAVFSALDLGDIDVIVASDYPDGPPRKDSRYHRVDLLEDPMDAVLPVGHPLAREAGVRLETLASEVWVGSDAGDPCSQILQAVCAAAGFSPDIAHRCGEWPVVAALVAAGCGVALIPRLAQPLTDDVVVCPVVGTPATRQIFAAVRAGAQSDPVVAAVLDMLAAVAADRLAAPAVEGQAASRTR